MYTLDCVVEYPQSSKLFDPFFKNLNLCHFDIPHDFVNSNVLKLRIAQMFHNWTNV